MLQLECKLSLNGRFSQHNIVFDPIRDFCVICAVRQNDPKYILVVFGDLKAIIRMNNICGSFCKCFSYREVVLNVKNWGIRVADAFFF